jgi:hypothetical protein
VAVTEHAPRDLPWVVRQALDDTTLPALARLTMWHLSRYLDTHEYRELKVVALAHEMRCKDVTCAQNLRLLLAKGYLDEHKTRKPRALRLPASRRVSPSRAWPDDTTAGAILPVA